MAMDQNQDKTALETIELLESRLQRVQFFLTGRAFADADVLRIARVGDDDCIPARLKRLEKALMDLSATSRVAHDALSLYAQYPDLFQSQPASAIPASLTTASVYAIVNACATLYQTSASQLISIQDLPIPSANDSASLIALAGRLQETASLQDAQSAEIEHLRSRSVALIARWYQLCVLGGGKCWVEWERRVGIVERDVRRQEFSRTREQNPL